MGVFTWALGSARSRSSPGAARQRPGREVGWPATLDTASLPQETFDAGLQAFQQEGIANITALKDQLLAAKHVQSQAIEDRHASLMKRWSQLLADSANRKKKLLEAQSHFRKVSAAGHGGHGHCPCRLPLGTPRSEGRRGSRGEKLCRPLLTLMPREAPVPAPRFCPPHTPSAAAVTGGGPLPDLRQEGISLQQLV